MNLMKYIKSAKTFYGFMVSTTVGWVALGIGTLIAIFGGFIWPFYNLMPEYVTETAEIIVNDNRGCYVQTMDNYLIKANKCGDAEPGEFRSVEYDAKIKQRMDASVRHP